MDPRVEQFMVIIKAKILFGPDKDANADFAEISGPEMTRNLMRLSFLFRRVDTKLHAIVKNIHNRFIKSGVKVDSGINNVNGTTTRTLHKVANVIIAKEVIRCN